MVKLKIILVGPSQAGKSTIANFLSEAVDYSSYEYRPTPGVRILEFELNNKNIEVELWDCSGEDRNKNNYNYKYEPYHELNTTDSCCKTGRSWSSRKLSVKAEQIPKPLHKEFQTKIRIFIPVEKESKNGVQ